MDARFRGRDEQREKLPVRGVDAVGRSPCEEAPTNSRPGSAHATTDSVSSSRARPRWRSTRARKRRKQDGDQRRDGRIEADPAASTFGHRSPAPRTMRDTTPHMRHPALHDPHRTRGRRFKSCPVLGDFHVQFL